LEAVGQRNPSSANPGVQIRAPVAFLNPIAVPGLPVKCEGRRGDQGRGQVGLSLPWLARNTLVRRATPPLYA
jgi:hypothetical protein